MRKLGVILLACLLVGELTLCYQVINLSIANQSVQQDYAEINDIKYGLFSINQWKFKISEVVNEEVAKFNITGSDRKQLKPMIEEQLNSLIDNVYQQIREANEETLTGSIKQVFLDSFVDLKDIKSGIPDYADDVLKLIQRPKNKTEVKVLLMEKFENYFQRTFEKQDLSHLKTIREKMGGYDLEKTRELINAKIAANLDAIYFRTWLMIGLAILMFAIAFINQDSLMGFEFLMLISTLLALLATGVTTPMINLEAKITEMSFVLFDHPVQFLDQILYFQSKSILDVFGIMIIHPEIQMKIVGIMMIAFSIIFPVLKLASTVLYFYAHERFEQNRIVKFFVLKSGKWSMTDVLVIAIFMAYIGLNGVISSQFGKLHSANEELVLLTTNGTSLQPGFYLFLTYAVLALFLTEILTRSKEANLKN